MQRVQLPDTAYSVSKVPKSKFTVVLLGGDGSACVYKCKASGANFSHRWIADPGHVIMLNKEVALCSCREYGLVTYDLDGSIISHVHLDSSPSCTLRMDDNRFIVANELNEVHMYTHNAGYDVTLIRKTCPVHMRAITCMDLYGSVLVTGAQDGYCGVWDANTLMNIAYIKYTEEISCVAVSGDLIVVGTTNGSVWLNAIGNQFQLVKLLKHLHGTSMVTSVHVIAVALVVSTAMNGTVIFYRPRAEKVLEQRKTNMEVIWGSVVSDGAVIVVGRGSKDGNKIKLETVVPEHEIRQALWRVS